MNPGTTIGPYEVLGLLGQGGMGEVYRARHARLERDVALKVLPKELAANPDRLRRFEQEARTLAGLDHPNLLVIHDTGVHEGEPYLVSELLVGRTLREALSEGPPPVRRAVEWAVQIAQGLAAILFVGGLLGLAGWIGSWLPREVATPQPALAAPGADRIVLHATEGHELREVAEFTRFLEGEMRAWSTEILPGATALLAGCTRHSLGADQADVVAIPLGQAGSPKRLARGYAAHYVKSGHLVYAQYGSLLAVPLGSTTTSSSTGTKASGST